ncbi:MAG: cytochrome P450 [Acidovorax sp.]
MNRCPVDHDAATLSASAKAPAPVSIAQLPGPRGWPVLGSRLQLDGAAMHRTLEAWCARYGDRYRFRVGARTIVVFSDPEAIRDMLRDRPDGFQRSQRLVDVLAEMGPTGLFAANGATWRAQRPLVMAALDPAHLRHFFPTLAQVTQRLLARWQRAARSGEDLDLPAELTRYTVDVVASLALGADINTIEDQGPAVQQHLNAVFSTAHRRLFASFSYWRWLKLPADRAFDRHAAELGRLVRELIAAARQRLADDPQRRERPPNLIEALVCARDQDGGPLTDEDVAGNVLTMLVAGEDTTAHTLAWMLRLLGQEPEAWRRAREEVQQVAGAAPFPQDYAQAEQLPYLTACAHEAMRLKPVAPLLGLQAVRATVVGGVRIPAGGIAMGLLRPAAVDEARWPQAGRFLPERWLEGGAAHAQAHSTQRVAMPFGAGPRICPGRMLALLEIRMAAAMLLKNFRIEELTPPAERGRELLAVTMRPAAMRVRLHVVK